MIEARPVRNTKFSIKSIGQKTLIYSTHNKAIHVLNPVAWLIWELCDGKHTIKDIERALRINFAVEEGYDVNRAIWHTLEIFAGKGLLM